MLGGLRAAAAMLAAFWTLSAAAGLGIKSLKCESRRPWNGYVDIDVEITNLTQEATLTVSAKDTHAGVSLPVRSIWRDGDESKSPELKVPSEGTYRLVWDAGRDVTNLVASVTFDVQVATGSTTYMVVDLSAGPGASSYPVTYLKSVPSGGWPAEFKTTKMAFRSLGKSGSTPAAYVGVYPVTQRQYALVMGEEPSWNIGDTLPVEYVSYADIRGDRPAASGGFEISEESFFGRLRAATRLNFDLPTEAQWNRACLAGAPSGKDFGQLAKDDGGAALGDDPFLSEELARRGCYAGNCPLDDWGYDCTAEVGSYAANYYGFYDMHGNVWEWCRDVTGTEAQGYGFVLCGGSYESWAVDCVASARNRDYDLYGCDETTGFRAVCEQASGGADSHRLAKGFAIDVRPTPIFASSDMSIRCNPAWVGASSCTFACDGVQQGEAITEETFTWSPAGNGRHELTLSGGGKTLSAVCYAASGCGVTLVATYKATNVWSKGTHIISFPVTVRSGAKLTITSEAVVKFADGASLTVEPGGTVIAKGVIFTHVNDDTVGKQVITEPGAQPQDGRYTISGNIVEDEKTEYRYLGARTLTEDIAADTVLRSGVTYVIDGNLAVNAGATLTVPPGSVVKFAAGSSLNVNGKLVANGTLTQPVVFTSLRDDAHGGDSNGDGARTTPAAGDWQGLVISGEANLAHCQLLYGSDRTDVGAVHVTGGAVTLDACEIAHGKFECVRVNAGTLTAKNSVFRDTSTAFGYHGGDGVKVVNCVIADCSIASRGPAKQFTNTVFCRCLSFLLQQGSTDCSYCLFFNPEGYGEQAMPALPEDRKCLWGDPLFADAASGDFTPLSAESPCVDAANGTEAPDKDKLGNARLNVDAVQPKHGVPKSGKYPDLGVVEFYNEGGGEPADLVAAGVTAPATATVGEKMSVTYKVKNIGSKATGIWSDGIAFVSTNGATVVSAGMVRAAPPEGGVPKNKFFGQTVSVTVPVLPPGEWCVRVTANAGRELRENETSNNSYVAATVTTVSMTASPASGSVTRTVAYGYPVGLLYEAGAKNRVLDIVAPPGAVIRYGVGFVPSAMASSGEVVVGADGTAQISLMAGAQVYVVISSDIAGTVIVTPLEATLAVYGVNPCVIVRRDVESGEALLTVDGLLFGEDATVSLKHVDQGVVVSADRVTCLSSERLVASFDPSKTALPYTGEWILSVTSAGATAEAEQRIMVTDEDLKPELVCTAELPASLRQGRTFDFTLNYRVADGAQVALKAPIVTVRSPQLLFKTDHATYTNEVRLVALGQPGSEGELLPGVSYQLHLTAMVRTDVELEKVWYETSVLTASTAGSDGTLPAGEFLSLAKLATATGAERTRLEALQSWLGRTWVEFFDRFSAFVTRQGTYGLADIDYAVMVNDYARHALNELREADYRPEERISQIQPTAAAAKGETVLPIRNKVIAWNETDVRDLASIRARTAANLAQLTQLIDAYKTPGNVWVYDQGYWYRLVSGSGENANVSSHYHADYAHTVVLCHGALESIHSSWVNEAAAALATVGAWPTDEPQNVLAVEWGVDANADATAEELAAMEQGAAGDAKTFAWMGGVTAGHRSRIREAEYGFAPALRVAKVARNAYSHLSKVEIPASKVTLIGVGHGAHVAGAIAGRYVAKSGGKVRRLVGLETSSLHAFAFVAAADKYPKAWSQDSAEVTEFYKSTCWLSAGAHVGEGVEQVIGHFNFTVVPAKDRFGERAFFEGRSLRADEGRETTCGGALGYLLNADCDTCEGRTNLYLSRDVARWFAVTVRKCGYDPEYGGWCGLGWSWMEKASPPKFALPYSPYVKDLRTDYPHGFHAVIRERDRAIDLICPEALP